MTTREELYDMFRERGFKRGAEIGVAYANNAVSMYERIPGLSLYLIDPWDGENRSKKFYRTVRRRALQNLMPYRQRAKIMSTKSEYAALDVPERSLDFVYIDGDHRYDAVLLDIVLWHRRVRGGGIVSGHDYGLHPKLAGVKAAVDGYTKFHGIDLNVCETSWWWEVK